MKHKIFFRSSVTINALMAVLVGFGVVVVACPADGGGPTTYRYACENGTGADATFDAAADGIERCASCTTAGYFITDESTCVRGQAFVCPHGVASAAMEATADNISRCVSCTGLYTLAGVTDEIGTSCRMLALGEARQIGSATNFGISLGVPESLAAFGGTLYMTAHASGSGNNLYTLDATTGVASRRGSANKFGAANETTPRGLAAVGNTLYMLGTTSGYLLTANISDGTATRVGIITYEPGVSENFPTGLAGTADTLYMLGRVTAQLFTLNIDSTDMTPDGMAIRVGDGTVNQFGVSEQFPSGLAAIGNTLYMLGDANNALYRLNAATGRAIRVGMVTQFGVRESSALGLTALGTTLYMVGDATDALYVLRYE